MENEDASGWQYGAGKRSVNIWLVGVARSGISFFESANRVAVEGASV